MVDYTDLIDKYIQKKTTTEELEKIRQLVKEDPAFKNELYLQLELRTAIKREETQKLKKRLQNLEQKKRNKPSFSLVWKVAAVFILGLGFLWFFNLSPDYERLYTENFEPYPNIISPSVRDKQPAESIKEKAFNYYDNRNYKEAAKAFDALYKEEELPYAYFYYGMSLMADHQIEKAIATLESPDWEIPEKFQDQTHWYLALGYLKTKDKDKAIPYLEKVIKADHAMATPAKSLLIKIK